MVNEIKKYACSIIGSCDFFEDDGKVNKFIEIIKNLIEEKNVTRFLINQEGLSNQMIKNLLFVVKKFISNIEIKECELSKSYDRFIENVFLLDEKIYFNSKDERYLCFNRILNNDLFIYQLNEMMNESDYCLLLISNDEIVDYLKQNNKKIIIVS